MDAASRRNLEIDTNLMGGHLHTLAWVMDRTATSMGGRELRRWLNRHCGMSTLYPSANRRYRPCSTVSITSRFTIC